MNHLINKAQKVFCDKIVLKVKGGHGGAGFPKFGGIGGKGGDVHISGNPYITRLEAVLRHRFCKNGWYTASDGNGSVRSQLLGSNGADMNIKVPIGVTIHDSDNQYVGEINSSKDKITVALGGRGGDKFNDGHGFAGQERTLRLDLQMMSDAVFVGFPNAGKSSLLTQISQARPMVADYPFTTLRPYMGVVKFEDFRRITMADLPGLIEGAHKNIGLGHEFLKHIVRSRILIFVIDVNRIDLGPNYTQRSPLEVLCTLNKEIELYDDTILKKPAILAVNKVDSFKPESEEMIKFNEFMKQYEALQKDIEILDSMPEMIRPSKVIDFHHVLPISAANRLGLNELKQASRRLIDEMAELDKFERDNFTSFKDISAQETNRLVQ